MGKVYVDLGATEGDNRHMQYTGFVLFTIGSWSYGYFRYELFDKEETISQVDLRISSKLLQLV